MSCSVLLFLPSPEPSFGLLTNARRYLIHSPYVAKEPLQLQQAWLELEKIKNSGKAKSIGVANHQRPHLETILQVATIIPAINQLEFHPYLQRAHSYLPWMREKGIQVASFNGLTPISKARPGPLDRLLAHVAAKHGVSEGTVLLQWQMQQNVVPITTTKKTSRLPEYIEALGLKLSVEEVEEITQVGLSHHFRAWAPDRFDPEDRS